MEDYSLSILFVTLAVSALFASSLAAVRAVPSIIDEPDSDVPASEIEPAGERYAETARAWHIRTEISLVLAIIFTNVFGLGFALILVNETLAGDLARVGALIGAGVISSFLGFAVPLGIGRRWPQAFASVARPTAIAAVTIMRPLLVFWSASDRKARLSGDGEESTMEELGELIDTAHEEGTIDASEYRILQNIMRFSDVPVSDVMTPRTVVFALPSALTVADAAELPDLMNYSRFPIYDEETLDTVSGYVLSKDVLFAAIKGRNSLTLRDIARDVYYVPETIPLDKALEVFIERKEHLFVVVDEYGGVEGLITMEDVFETILGVEILDEVDNVADLRTLAKQRRDHRIAMQAENRPQGESDPG